MPSWNDVLNEIQQSKRIDGLDFVRRKYLKEMHSKFGRNVIAYYSGWLQKPGLEATKVNDDDKNGLMAAIHKLDRKKGLDLILHTEGGSMVATESIVHYLRKMFGTDIRAIIPQLAMSAGTMIACSCEEIVMGKQSNIGPIDPQYGGISCHGVIEEFETAFQSIKEDPDTAVLWKVIIGKYHPTFIGDCQKAIELSEELLDNWLSTGMFRNEKDSKKKAKKIVEYLGSHKTTKTHSRHIHIEDAKKIGLKIKSLEKDLPPEFQDILLTIHHAYMHTLANTPTLKIIENHLGNAVVLQQTKA